MLWGVTGILLTPEGASSCKGANMLFVLPASLSSSHVLTLDLKLKLLLVLNIKYYNKKTVHH